MSQNAAYMTVRSSMTSLFGGRIHQPKATRDDGRHQQEQGAVHCGLQTPTAL